MKSNFRIAIPVEICEKSDKGWKIKGIASTEDRDLQGEVVKQNGLDFSHIHKGLGLFNWNHKNDPQYILGKIDAAKVQGDKTVVEGYLFEHQDNAKALVNIMRSLKPEDKGRVQMSIEGKIVERGGSDNKTIKAAKVEKVALTLDPVNPHTYTELVKSLMSEETLEVEQNDVELIKSDIQKLDEKIDELTKMLSVGGGGDAAPATRSGGAALPEESLDSKKKKLKKENIEDDEEELKKPDVNKAFSREDIINLLHKSVLLRMKKAHPELSLEKCMQVVDTIVEQKLEKSKKDVPSMIDEVDEFEIGENYNNLKSGLNSVFGYDDVGKFEKLYSYLVSALKTGDVDKVKKLQGVFNGVHNRLYTGQDKRYEEAAKKISEFSTSLNNIIGSLSKKQQELCEIFEGKKNEVAKSLSALADLIKGRKGLPIGTIRTWQGVDYKKITDKQWVPVGKTKAEAKKPEGGDFNKPKEKSSLDTWHEAKVKEGGDNAERDIRRDKKIIESFKGLTEDDVEKFIHEGYYKGENDSRVKQALLKLVNGDDQYVTRLFNSEKKSIVSALTRFKSEVEGSKGEVKRKIKFQSELTPEVKETEARKIWKKFTEDKKLKVEYFDDFDEVDGWIEKQRRRGKFAYEVPDTGGDTAIAVSLSEESSEDEVQKWFDYEMARHENTETENKWMNMKEKERNEIYNPQKIANSIGVQSWDFKNKKWKSFSSLSDLEEFAGKHKDFSGIADKEKTYYRYGKPPEGFQSRNWGLKFFEGGVSAYPEQSERSVRYEDRQYYKFQGRQVGWGSDGEPLVIPTSDPEVVEAFQNRKFEDEFEESKGQGDEEGNQGAKSDKEWADKKAKEYKEKTKESGGKGEEGEEKREYFGGVHPDDSDTAAERQLREEWASLKEKLATEDDYRTSMKYEDRMSEIEDKLKKKGEKEDKDEDEDYDEEGEEGDYDEEGGNELGMPDDLWQMAKEMYEDGKSYRAIVNDILDTKNGRKWFEKKYNGNEFDLRQELENYINDDEDETKKSFDPDSRQLPITSRKTARLSASDIAEYKRSVDKIERDLAACYRKIEGINDDIKDAEDDRTKSSLEKKLDYFKRTALRIKELLDETSAYYNEMKTEYEEAAESGERKHYEERIAHHLRKEKQAEIEGNPDDVRYHRAEIDRLQEIVNENKELR